MGASHMVRRHGAGCPCILLAGGQAWAFGCRPGACYRCSGPTSTAKAAGAHVGHTPVKVGGSGRRRGWSYVTQHRSHELPLSMVVVCM